jgi:hypothetical protein
MIKVYSKDSNYTYTQGFFPTFELVNKKKDKIINIYVSSDSLQSEGYLNKPLNVQDEDGDWVVKDLELVGRPCLTYTTVPNHDFDEQEMSRSIFITPRMDNQFIFNRRNSALEFMHGKTYNKMESYKRELELVPYMIMHLKEVLYDVDIINPHVKIVIDFLKQSNFYKRDFPKFNGLLKTITALNYYNHEQSNRVYSPDYSSPTLRTKCDDAGTIKIINNTRKGYLEATDGDGVDISGRMQHHRGTVQKQKSQTINTMGGEDVGVVINV